MRIGMIFECGLEGADKAVCTYLASQLRTGVEISSVTLDNKANLLRDAGKAATQLIADGCCCVLVVWDLRPAWPVPTAPCRAEESRAVRESLQASGVAASAPVHLICIEQELEAWLLANERAVAAYLSRPTHEFKVDRCKHPDGVRQPKAELINLFERARGRRYDDRVDAIRLLKAAPLDFKRMRRSTSFARFEAKLLAC